MKRILLAIFGLLVLSGCATAPVGLNVQRSVARSTGDISATILLETKYPKVKPEQIIVIAENIKGFLEASDLNTITREELIAGIQSKITIQVLKNLAYKIVSKVPQETSLVEGKVVMIDMLDQIILAAGKFNPEDIKKTEE